MKDEITDSLKPPLMKRSSDIGYWKLNEMPASNECLRRKHKFLNFWGKTIWRNYDKRAKSKWERRVSNRCNHIRKRGVTVTGWESRTLNEPTLGFDKQLCYCTFLCKMSKVNYLRGKYNKRSAAPFMPSIVFCILRFLTVV